MDSAGCGLGWGLHSRGARSCSPWPIEPCYRWRPAAATGGPRSGGRCAAGAARGRLEVLLPTSGPVWSLSGVSRGGGSGVLHPMGWCTSCSYAHTRVQGRRGCVGALGTAPRGAPVAWIYSNINPDVPYVFKYSLIKENLREAGGAGGAALGPTSTRDETAHTAAEGWYTGTGRRAWHACMATGRAAPARGAPRWRSGSHCRGGSLMTVYCDTAQWRCAWWCCTCSACFVVLGGAWWCWSACALRWRRYCHGLSCFALVPQWRC